MAATEGADLTRTGNSPATAEIVAHAFAHVKRLIWVSPSGCPWKRVAPLSVRAAREDVSLNRLVNARLTHGAA